ncbi:glutathione S-transferase family protein [Massilia sp. ST3]|uniref:glutathione S-transferase family protein n=1 Tax=Massilia sp. ST3 TaxID=2824903 RepID=UPI001B81F8C3|nr:glutathione S-transferase N-terminal domain-containing protein [Massilia sp. ST3]MBQ5946209.1 glutathione S-transferase N-terminal domain-containing protein [Massilia sp. ST3]
MLTIIGKAGSINVRKVLWTCAVLGLPYRREEWNEEHAALNPNRMVPVLVDEDFVLWESNTICRYLAGRYGGAALLPRDPQERAQVEQWMDWQATELNTAWRYAFMALVRASPAHRDPAQVEASIVAWNRLVGLLDARLGQTGAYVAGERFTLADIVLGVSVNRWLMTPMQRPGYPQVDAWYARLAAHAGFSEHCANGTP